jgi:hypothetical protein
MLSRTPLPFAAEHGNVLTPDVHALLTKLCAAPDLHARFLNTLSLLEHIGSRKIMATQSGPAMSQEALKHLAEETRHAFFFKRAAENVARTPLDYSDTMAGAAARAYMGRLDAHIAKTLGEHTPAECAYLYMSLIVELRAVWFYRLYQDTLAGQKHSLSLKSVLAEEERHLDEMRTRLAALDPHANSRTQSFAAYEATRFALLWSAVGRACA